MIRTLFIGMLLLFTGLFALNGSDIGVNNETSHSISLLNINGSQVWQISDGKAQPLAQPVNTQSSRTEYNLQIEVTSTGQIHLNWNDIAGATGYHVYHCAYPASPLGLAPWETWETTDSEYSFNPTETAYQNLGFFYVTAITETPTIPENFVFVEGGTVAGITVSDFYLDKYELTQAEYQAVMGTNPSSGYGVGSNYPVYNVSWFDAIEYCNRRSIQEGLTPCYSYSTYGTDIATWPIGWNTSDANHANVNCDFSAIGYRLPKASEWEYAARGGLQTHDYTYSGSSDINAVAWYSSNSGLITHPVGDKLANELGIYDMSGNVFEWCWDMYYGIFRVMYGGSSGDVASSCSVSSHNTNSATFTHRSTGFRVCRCCP